jgi:N-acetylmuramoyl-L-alanine amidase
VVVEPGFITNPDEVKVLSTAQASEPLVRAMARAVRNYFGVADPEG